MVAGDTITAGYLPYSGMKEHADAKRLAGELRATGNYSSVRVTRFRDWDSDSGYSGRVLVPVDEFRGEYADEIY